MKNKRLILSLPLGMLIIPQSAAAEKVSLGIYPPLIRIHTEQNAAVTTPIAVINNSDKKISLSINLRAIRLASQKDGAIEYYPSTEVPKAEADFLKSVTIKDGESSVKSIELYPNESKTLMLTFTAPTTTDDYYFSTIFSSKAEGAGSDNTIIRTSSGIATNVLVSIGGSTKPQGVITEFDAPKLVLGGPVHMTLTVGNTGKTYTTVSGTVTIYDLFGNKAGQIPLKTVTILSDGTRIMSPELPQAASNTGEIAWGEKFLLGGYSAQAVVSFDKTYSTQATSSFFAIPLFVLLAVTAVFFIILSILFRTLKKVNFKES